MVERKEATRSVIEDLLKGANLGAVDGGPFVRRFKRADDFILEYSPISYTIEGVLPSGAIYGVTGRRGTARRHG